jgi:DNA-binding MarR family transcriptional regulator
MAQMFSENAQAVLRYLQADPNGQYTADDLADALGLTSRQINGTATGLQKKGLTERVVVEGIEKKVIRLTPEGLSVDPAAEKPAE